MKSEGKFENQFSDSSFIFPDRSGNLLRKPQSIERRYIFPSGKMVINMKTAYSNKKEFIDSSKEIGRRLAEIRKSKHISQTEAAKILGVTQSSLSQLESGFRMWSVPSVIKLIKFYKVPYEDVFGTWKGAESELQLTVDDDIAAPIAVLEMLAQTSDLEEISMSVKAYIYVCVYRMFRHLYDANPKNTSVIFSLDLEVADRITEKIFTEEPSRLNTFIKYSSRINSQEIELPVEYSQKLRELVGKCENLIKAYIPEVDLSGLKP